VKSPGNDEALQELLQEINAVRGFSCNAYKESGLRRRLAVRMRACGVHTFAQYAQHLHKNTAEYDRLIDALTINVTKFYRNADTWDRLATTVVPDLLLRRGSAFRCWSAGCASGEEAYTLAVILLDEARKRGGTNEIAGCIDATDYDVKSLKKAGEGCYPEEAFDEMPNSLTARYFHRIDEHPDSLSISEPVRRLVRFARHDVITDPPPNPPYDLILFRNVVIYFDRPTQERIFLEMANALASGGVLVLGKVETVFGAAREILQLEDVRERVYRRQ
jgi:chemotaxis methyl-accepting protein methylase